MEDKSTLSAETVSHYNDLRSKHQLQKRCHDILNMLLAQSIENISNTSVDKCNILFLMKIKATTIFYQSSVALMIDEH